MFKGYKHASVKSVVGLGKLNLAEKVNELKRPGPGNAPFLPHNIIYSCNFRENGVIFNVRRDGKYKCASGSFRKQL